MKRQVCFGEVAMFALLLLCVCSPTIIESVAGGCFAQKTSRKKCAVFLYKNLSIGECCSRGGQYYTLQNDSFENIFRHMIKTDTGGMDDCHSCEDWLKKLKPETCKTKVCPRGQVCRMFNNTVRCVCDNTQCRGIYKPVCSSLNITYQSECHMKYAACLGSREESAEYNGTCRASCAQVQCSNNKQCIQDQTNILYCVHCNNNCNGAISRGSKLCGLNNVTYPSACHLRKATCQLGKTIGIAYDGSCGTENCNTMKCAFGQNCIMNGIKPICVDCSSARRSCKKIGQSVCGSDGKTYPSLCALKKHICLKNKLIDVVHYGNCTGGPKKIKGHLMTLKQMKMLRRTKISVPQFLKMSRKMGLSLKEKDPKKILEMELSVNRMLCYIYNIVNKDKKIKCK